MKDKTTKQLFIKAAMVIIFLAIFSIALVLINNFEREPLTSSEGQKYEKAVVTEVTVDNLQEDGNRYGEQKVVIKVKSGEHKDEEIEAISPSGTLFGANCTVGMKVIAIINTASDTVVATIYSQDRSFSIIAFVIIFILAICLIGGKKGVKSVVSLAFTLICIFFILFPMMYKGISPILMSIVISAIVTIFTMFFVGGINQKSVAAIVGTVCGVIMAGASAYLFGKSSGIGGYNVSNIETLSFVAQYCKLHIGELLFAGIIISSLGAVMDVGMSIASTINEIHDKKPELTSTELFKSGINVGRDMMGTMSNTLILAFVGGSLSTLMVNYAYNLPMNQLVNSYNIGIEIMQGVAGSLGIVLTVPVTALITSILIKKQEQNKEC